MSENFAVTTVVLLVSASVAMLALVIALEQRVGVVESGAKHCTEPSDRASFLSCAGRTGFGG